MIWNIPESWKKTLADIEKAKFQKEDFLKMIKEFTAQSVKTIKEDKIFASKVAVPDSVKVIGICPECGNPVIESEKAYGCSNWKNGCRFTVWKQDRFIESMGKPCFRRNGAACSCRTEGRISRTDQ